MKVFKITCTIYRTPRWVQLTKNKKTKKQVLVIAKHFTGFPLFRTDKIP